MSTNNKPSDDLIKKVEEMLATQRQLAIPYFKHKNATSKQAEPIKDWMVATKTRSIGNLMLGSFKDKFFVKLKHEDPFTQSCNTEEIDQAVLDVVGYFQNDSKCTKSFICSKLKSNYDSNVTYESIVRLSLIDNKLTEHNDERLGKYYTITIL